MAVEVEKDWDYKKKKTEKKTIRGKSTSDEDLHESDAFANGADGEDDEVPNWKELLVLNQVQSEEGFEKFLKDNKINEQENEFEVVLSEDVEPMEFEAEDLKDSLEIFLKEPTSFDLDPLINNGFNLNLLGVKMYIDQKGNLIYSKDLSGLIVEKVRMLIDELDSQADKFDVSTMSDELKTFLGDNLKKMEQESLVVEKMLEVEIVDEEDEKKEKRNIEVVVYDSVLNVDLNNEFDKNNSFFEVIRELNQRHESKAKINKEKSFLDEENYSCVRIDTFEKFVIQPPIREGERISILSNDVEKYLKEKDLDFANKVVVNITNLVVDNTDSKKVGKIGSFFVIDKSFVFDFMEVVAENPTSLYDFLKKENQGMPIEEAFKDKTVIKGKAVRMFVSDRLVSRLESKPFDGNFGFSLSDYLISKGIVLESEEIKNLDSNSSQKDKSDSLPQEVLIREFVPKKLEQEYAYFAKIDGLISDLKTIYTRPSEVGGDETSLEILKKNKKDSFERLGKFKVGKIEKDRSVDDKSKITDYLLGKELVDLLDSYLKSDGNFEKIDDLEYLLTKNGISDFSRIENARKYRHGGILELKNIPKNVEMVDKPESYEGLYNDLWLVENGNIEDVQSAVERISSHGINLPKFDKDGVDYESYKLALKAIKENNFVAWGKKRENAENFIKKILEIRDVVESVVKNTKEGRVVKEFEKNNVEVVNYYKDGLLKDLRVVYSENEKSEYKEALDRLESFGVKILWKKGDRRDTSNELDMLIFRIENYFLLNNEDVNEKDFIEKWSKILPTLEKSNIKVEYLAKARKIMHGENLDNQPEVVEINKESVENKVKVVIKEKVEEEKVWDQKLFDELEAGTSGINRNKEYYEAREKLIKRGIDLSKIAKSESDGIQKSLLSAITVVKSNKPDENFTVDLAKQKIMGYFGFVEVKDKKNERENNKRDFVVRQLQELGRLEKLRGKDTFSRVDQMRLVRDMVDAGYSYLERVINEESPDKADKMLSDLCLAGRLVDDVELRKNYPNQWANTIKFFQILGLKMI